MDRLFLIAIFTSVIVLGLGWVVLPRVMLDLVR